MIIKKCRKCGREFGDNSMLGQQSTCDMCSPNVSFSQSRIERYWPGSDGYNDSREDVDRFNEEKGGGVW